MDQNHTSQLGFNGDVALRNQASLLFSSSQIKNYSIKFSENLVYNFMYDGGDESSLIRHESFGTINLTNSIFLNIGTIRNSAILSMVGNDSSMPFVKQKSLINLS